MSNNHVIPTLDDSEARRLAGQVARWRFVVSLGVPETAAALLVLVDSVDLAGGSLFTNEGTTVAESLDSLATDLNSMRHDAEERSE